MSGEQEGFLTEDDAVLAKAEELIRKNYISMEEHARIAAKTPSANNMPLEEAIVVIKRRHQSNVKLAQVEQDALFMLSGLYPQAYRETPDCSSIDSLIVSITDREDFEQISMTTTASMDEIFLLYLSENFPAPIIERRQLLGAATNIGIRLASEFYRQSKEQQSKKELLSYVRYFASLQNLLLGARTAASHFALHPDQIAPALLRTISFVYEDGKETNRKNIMRFLIEGVATVHSLGDGTSFVLEFKPDEVE